MGISIRDPEVSRLARELADLRKTNVTEAIAHALREGLDREHEQRVAEDKTLTMRERLESLGRETLAMAGPNPRPVTKEDIDEMWGQ